MLLPYLVGADLVNTMLSASLAFCGRPVYLYYVKNPNPFGVSLLRRSSAGRDADVGLSFDRLSGDRPCGLRVRLLDQRKRASP